MTNPEWDYHKEELSASDKAYFDFVAGRSKHCAECDDVAEDDGKVREFDTGATRDTDDGKLDYEGFLSPGALRRYAEYMHSHRKQSDGKMRDSDNWQKGIPLDCYMKSLWRHVVEMWTIYRAKGLGIFATEEMEDAACAVIFNAFGFLHEITQDGSDAPAKEPEPFGIDYWLKKDPPAKAVEPMANCDTCKFYSGCGLPQKDLGAMFSECIGFARKAAQPAKEDEPKPRGCDYCKFGGGCSLLEYVDDDPGGEKCGAFTRKKEQS